MSTYVLVLRNFSGLTAGEVIDASDWLHTKPLEDDRFVKTLEHVDAEKRRKCECGLVVLPDAKLHDCEVLKAQREAAVAEKVAAAKEKAQAAQQAAPATTSTPAPQPAAPAAQKAAAAADKPVADTPITASPKQTAKAS